MNMNIPVLALSAAGVLMVAGGIFLQGGSIFLIGIGVVVILLAWILQEGSKRRS